MTDSLVAVAFNLKTQLYLEFSALALLTFDYFLTFNAEITWTWDSSRNAVHVLFLLVRYVPFVLIPTYIYYVLGNVVGNCSSWSEGLSWMIIITILAAELLLLIRTWVLWGKKRIVLIGLIVLIVACAAESAVVSVFAVESTFSNIPLPPSLAGCFESYQPATSVWTFFGLAVFELVILILTISQLFHHDRKSRIYRMMRNDIVYVLCILGMSVIGTIIIKVGYYQDPALSLQVVIHSVLASRLLFSLRAIMHQQHIMSASVSVAQSSYDVEMLPMAFVEGPGASSGAINVAS
ncbi:hypothetical protein BJ138DRAFT_395503 [Hygrophoropsis aurantiaca]|uniref:Uncharacterized protein n=1 Tax=Hygrophoropsis aurantiaca TaxID=72124 RepID=A0ACB8A657_9AGAM|nr:hypothetical protein BJ138DRAFT_395503 [Hygrophoropsis aurantiaca]